MLPRRIRLRLLLVLEARPWRLMSDLEARIAEMLHEHESWWPSIADGATHCECGNWKDDSCMQTENHRNHVAAMLAPLILEAQAEALRAPRNLDSCSCRQAGDLVKTCTSQPPCTNRERNSMPTQIEAKRLSGVDRGKHVQLMVPGGRFGDWELAGELIGTQHWGDGTVDILVAWNGESRGPRIANHLPPETVVTITGRTP